MALRKNDWCIEKTISEDVRVECGRHVVHDHNGSATDKHHEDWSFLEERGKMQ